MNLEELIRQAENLVFHIGNKASHEELQVPARNLLRGLYALGNKTERNNLDPDDEEALHVEKAKRKLEIWAEAYPDSIPAKILFTFLSQKKGKEMPRSVLEFYFQGLFASTKSREANIELAMKFGPNFNQMKNFGEKNHAKIFDVDQEGFVTIWPPIEKYVAAFYKVVSQK